MQHDPHIEPGDVVTIYAPDGTIWGRGIASNDTRPGRIDLIPDPEPIGPTEPNLGAR